jgi:alkanesulfonate monooxygenase SsuD/methylene tetrahydromethanopterin reductase-like flavin-dependent oxidoreductase (luciferase family)
VGAGLSGLAASGGRARRPYSALVEGRILEAEDAGRLRDDAARAEAEGCDAVIVREGSLGDPVVLAAGLSPSLPRVLIGVQVQLSTDDRHPAVLARDVTTLDLVCGGRSLVCFGPPFDDELAEAIDLCRALWREGEATREGPHFPVRAAVNRPRPAGEGSPLIALDLTRGEETAGSVASAADLLLRPTGDAGLCEMVRS